jgi:hypothetical protein
MSALRTILALIAGLVVGSFVNGTIVAMGTSFIPSPAGADMTTVEGLTASMHLLEPKHFLMPFLAHALGTLAGALVAASIATLRRSIVAYAIGVLFLCGGIAASVMIPAPTWFIVLDLAAAYIPMAWLGLTLSRRVRRDA